MAKRNSAKIRTTVYSRFRGADFSTDPSLVETCRSPLCTNIIASEGGMPEKRPGWRTIHTLPARINGLWHGTFAGAEKYLCHAGEALYALNGSGGEPVRLLTGLPDRKSRAMLLEGRLWIVTGAGFYCYDGTSAAKVTDTAPYIPTITITRNPTGGGVVHEQVNLLTPYRRESFQTDGTATLFTLSESADSTGTVRVWVWDEELTEGWSIDRAAGTVSFDSAPPAPEAGNADGLVIEYPHTVPGYADRIDKCTILSSFGVGNNDRLVLSGNGDFPNQDWISALNDPSYFPDLGYACIGSSATPIVGYCRVGAYQAIVKAESTQESTVYLRSGSLNEQGEAVFTTKPALSGVGAISQGSFAELLDDPLFLSGTGIHAISVSELTGSRITQNRSYFLNPRLTRELSLSEAEAVVWNGLYLLSAGEGRVYVLDARQEKSYRSASMGDFVYEAYYWENVPARVWLCVPDGERQRLYFGTEDGKVCMFSTDTDAVTRYADDGEAIQAVWASKYDDDGSPGLLKTLLRRGCCVTIKPYTRSSAKVYLRSDRSGGRERETAGGTVDIFDWRDIDFERLTFESDDSPREIFLAARLKNYKRLQIIVRNDEVNEGFGVYQITKLFVVGNFAKGSGTISTTRPDDAASDEDVKLSAKEAFEAVFGAGSWRDET